MQASSVKTKAIATRAVAYGESDMIITLVSVDLGRITAVAKGCLKPKAKLRYSAQPLNFGEYVLSCKNGRYVVTECSQIDAFTAITANLDRYYAAALILEVLQKLSQEPQPVIFLHALQSLKDLAYSTKDCDDIVADFLLQMLKDNGNELDFAHCNVCKCDLEGRAFFKDEDGVVCPHCKGFSGVPIEEKSRLFLANIDRQISHENKAQANMLLADLVYIMLGVRISPHYFTEQI